MGDSGLSFDYRHISPERENERRKRKGDGRGCIYCDIYTRPWATFGRKGFRPKKANFLFTDAHSVHMVTMNTCAKNGSRSKTLSQVETCGKMQPMKRGLSAKEVILSGVAYTIKVGVDFTIDTPFSCFWRLYIEMSH